MSEVQNEARLSAIRVAGTAMWDGLDEFVDSAASEVQPMEAAKLAVDALIADGWGPNGDTFALTPVEAASWIVQALMDPAAVNGEVTDRSAAAIFGMVRRYDATGIGWGGERSQASMEDQ